MNARVVVAGTVLVGMAGVALSTPPRPPPRDATWTPGPPALEPCRDAAPYPSRVEVTTEGQWRVIRSNGIPDGPVGAFPNRGNPNTIAEQRYELRVALEPAGPGRAFDLGRFGVALDGVPFDPGAAEWWHGDRRSGWQYDALGGAVPLGVDCNRAHVQPNGAYHYHGVPDGLVARLKRPGEMTLVGFAADGHPIYARDGHAAGEGSPLVALRPSWRLKDGERPGGAAPGGRHDGTFVQDWEFVPGAGDLDACNARVGWTPDFGETRYYVLTDAFPFIPRCFVAAPAPGFLAPPGRPG